jgi:O-antigen/teichoic acid export membrane protein
MRAFVKSSYYILISNIISKIFGLITLGTVSRSVGNENFGNYSAVQNASMSANMIGSLGVPTVLQMESANVSSYSIDNLSSIVSNCIILYVSANLTVCILLLLFPDFFSQQLLHSTLKSDYNIFLVFVLFLTSINQIPLYFLMGIGAFKDYARINLQSNSITLVCTILLLYAFELSLKSALSALVVSNFFSACLVGILFFRNMKKLGLKFTLNPELNQMYKILMSGFIYYLGNTLLVAVSGFVTISLFYKFLDPADYGYLRISSAFSMILAVIPASLQPVNLSKIFTEGNQKNLMSIQFRIIPFVSLLLTFLIILNIGSLISKIFGSDYQEGSDFIILMILLQIPVIYLGILVNYITALGYLTYIGFVSILGTVSFMVSIHFLIPYNKLDGYFYSSLIAMIISLIFAIPKVIQSKYTFSSLDIKSIVLNLLVVSTLIIILINVDLYKNLLSFTLAVFYCVIFYNFCLEQLLKIKIKKFLYELLMIAWKK